MTNYRAYILKKLHNATFILMLMGFNTLAYCEPLDVLIIYDSQSGHTRLMAEAVQTGAKKVAGIRVKLKSAQSTTIDEVKLAKAIIIGCPVYNANVTPAIQSFMNTWPLNDMHNKLGAAFVSAGGISAGQETTMLNILHTMLVFRMIIVGGDTWQTPFGVAAVVDEEPFKSSTLKISPQFIHQAIDLGERVAKISKLNGNGTRVCAST